MDAEQRLDEAYSHYCQVLGRKPQSTNAFKKALEKLTNVCQHRLFACYKPDKYKPFSNVS